MTLSEVATSISWATGDWCAAGGELLWEQVCQGGFVISGIPGPVGFRHAMIRKRQASTPLTDAEREALERLVRGGRPREMALGPGQSVGAPVSRVARAVRKSGVGSPIGLLRTWSILTAPSCEALQLLSTALVVRAVAQAWPGEEWLTGAELEIVTLVLAEQSSADISRLQGVSPRAVAHQLTSIFRKLGVADRYELAHLALMRRRVDSSRPIL